MPSVSEPATVAEAAAVLAGASARGARVSVERDGGDVVLLTRRLDRLLEHEAGDLTATVEAGITVRALNARLAGHGQMLALDPPGDPTVGAALAGDLFGPRAHRYGRPRDLVLGVTVVLGDGTVASAGGKVVKNVAGYDLGKLFCGSAGRLGLIVRASFRLHPLPDASRTLVVDVDRPQDPQRLASALARARLSPSAVDLLWEDGAGWLCVLFEGSERAVGEQLARARDLVGGSEDAAVWGQVAERQLASRGRRSLAPAELASALDTPGGDATGLVRLGPVCFAYTAAAQRQDWSPLAERVRAQLDPQGVLA